MPAIKNTFLENRKSSMKNIDPLIESGVLTESSSPKNVFDNENKSEMIMEIIVWITVVGLVLFSMQ